MLLAWLRSCFPRRLKLSAGTCEIAWPMLVSICGDFKVKETQVQGDTVLAAPKAKAKAKAKALGEKKQDDQKDAKAVGVKRKAKGQADSKKAAKIMKHAPAPTTSLENEIVCVWSLGSWVVVMMITMMIVMMMLLTLLPLI